jgi:hypothetical protein
MAPPPKVKVWQMSGVSGHVIDDNEHAVSYGDDTPLSATLPPSATGPPDELPLSPHAAVPGVHLPVPMVSHAVCSVDGSDGQYQHCS